jgi:HK97 family phage portal protein
MSWFTFLRSKPDAKFEVDIPPEMQEAMTAGGSLAPRISKKEALQVPAVLRSRNLIAGTLARLPIHIRDKKREEAFPTSLLEQIDPDVPNVVTFAQTYEDLLFESIAWWKVAEIGWHGYPVFAQHVSPERVHIMNLGMNGSTTAQVYIDGLPVRDDEVIRFDSPNPPLLRHAARAIRTCLRLDRTASMYAEEPMPQGFFTPKEGYRPKEDETTIQETLDKWAEARRQRAWGYVGAQWEAKALQFNAEQIQLADQRQHAVLEIARAAGIDPEDLGVSTTSRTYQNAEQRRQDLLDFTLAPYVAAVEQRLSMRDVIPRGYRAKVNFDGFLRADTKSRMEAYKIGSEVGAYTVPEIRELEDRPPTTLRMPVQEEVTDVG